MNKQILVPAIISTTIIAFVFTAIYLSPDFKENKTNSIEDIKQVQTDDKKTTEKTENKNENQTKEDNKHILNSKDGTKIFIEVLDEDQEKIRKDFKNSEVNVIDAPSFNLEEKNQTLSNLTEKDLISFWNGFFIIDGMEFNLINKGKYFQIKNEKDADILFRELVNANQKIEKGFVKLNPSVKLNNTYCANQYNIINKEKTDYINSKICATISTKNNNILEINGKLNIKNKFNLNDKFFSERGVLLEAKDLEKELVDFNDSDFNGKYISRLYDDKYTLVYKFKKLDKEFFIDSTNGIPVDIPN